jgi:peptide/nickel transport system substrate-binding protein
VPWNETYWSNERFNELLLQARSELDDDLRREMYFEMQQIVSDDGGIIIPMFAAYVGAIQRPLGHPEQIAATGAMTATAWRALVVQRLT